VGEKRKWPLQSLSMTIETDGSGVRPDARFAALLDRRDRRANGRADEMCREADNHEFLGAVYFFCRSGCNLSDEVHQ
jgi:hypothetical protein